MAKSKSSQRWLQEHFKDPYVTRAQREGFRSRAVYKLMEIQQKDAILFSGAKVVDLGAAPGGWSQYASTQVGENGMIIANDLLPIDPLPQVEFVQGDFRDDDVLQQLIDLLNNKQADLVISDMAPNMSGVGAVDQPRSVYLCELALEMAKNVLKPDGCFLVKVFQGEGSEALLKATRSAFKSVKIRKPSASRPRSREVYMLAQGYML